MESVHFEDFFKFHSYYVCTKSDPVFLPLIPFQQWDGFPYNGKQYPGPYFCVPAGTADPSDHFAVDCCPVYLLCTTMYYVLQLGGALGCDKSI